MLCKKCRKEIPEESVFCLYCGAKQVQSTKRNTKSRGNGQGSVYKMPNGKWRINVTVGYKIKDGKALPVRRTKSGFKTKKEALEYLPILKNEKRKTQSFTLNYFWEGWSSSAMLKLSKNKQSHFKTAYNKMQNIIFTKMEDLTINDLQKVVDENAETYYPAKDIKTLLSHLYKRAVAQQVVNTNLAEFIELPPLNEKERTPFEERELQALWKDYIDGNKLTGYILLMIYSGMMPGELFQAEKHMIDWENGTIIGCGLKTKKRKETPIVLADCILPVLKDLCEYSESEKLLSMGRDNFYKEFHIILERCGCRQLTPYSCRHTTATALALKNIVPSVIQQVMRHTKFSTTQRYIHVDTESMKKAVNKL